MEWSGGGGVVRRSRSLHHDDDESTTHDEERRSSCSTNELRRVRWYGGEKTAPTAVVATIESAVVAPPAGDDGIAGISSPCV